MEKARAPAPDGQRPLPANQTPVTVPTNPASKTPTPPALGPAPAPTPAAVYIGDDLSVKLPGMPLTITWSPSGTRAVIRLLGSDPTHYSSDRSYLLDLSGEHPSVQELPGLATQSLPVFWSEAEVLWRRQQDGGEQLLLRNLATGQDREMFTADRPLETLLRPGDQAFVYVRLSQVPAPMYPPQPPRGEIWASRLDQSRQPRQILKEGALIGRLADGRVLVQAYRDQAGTLAAIRSDGTLTWLSQQPVVHPAVAPDGSRALWFTLTRPLPVGVTVDPASLYPPVDTLWIWDGQGAPHSLDLGRIYSAEGVFSPDGRRIALSLDEGYGGDWRKPGHLTVVEGSQVRTLVNHDLHIAIIQWDRDGIIFSPAAAEKTGGSPAYSRIDLQGKVSSQTFAGSDTGLVYQLLPYADKANAGALILYWANSDVRRRIGPHPTNFPNLPSLPTDPYVGSRELDGLLLMRLYPVEP